MFLVLLACLLAFLASPVQATIRYAQLGAASNTNCTTGQNSATPLSGSTPLQTLQRGLTCTGPGDTLYLRAGNYGPLEDTSLTIPSGTSWSSPVIIASAPTETAQLSFLGIRNQVVQYVSFERLLIDGGGSPSNTTQCCKALGFDLQSHLRIRDSELRNSNDQLLTGGQGGDLQILNNHIHGAYTFFDPVGTWGGGCNNSMCITGAYCAYFNAHDSLIEGNLIEDCTSYGFHLYYGNASVIDNNIIRNNRWKHIGYDDGQRNQQQPSLLLSRGHNNQVYNNVFYGSTSPLHQASITTQNSGDIIVHNTIVGNHGAGVYLYPGSTGMTVRNNIIYQVTDVPIDGTTTPGVNMIGCSGAHPQCNFTGDPHFIAPQEDNYAIPVGSPACGVGEPLGSPYNLDLNGTTRTTWDAGAYACGAPVTPLPAPTNLHKTGLTP
jgi:parallel beta-helix repeat protein